MHVTVMDHHVSDLMIGITVKNTLVFNSKKMNW